MLRSRRLEIVRVDCICWINHVHNSELIERLNRDVNLLQYEIRESIVEFDDFLSLSSLQTDRCLCFRIRDSWYSGRRYFSPPSSVRLPVSVRRMSEGAGATCPACNRHKGLLLRPHVAIDLVSFDSLPRCLPSHLDPRLQ